MPSAFPPRLKHLPGSLPREDAVRIELAEGIPIFRASSAIQTRIASLPRRLQEPELNPQVGETHTLLNI